MIISLMFITATEVKLRQWGFKDEKQKGNIFIQLKMWIEIAKKEKAQGKCTEIGASLWAGAVLFSGVTDTCKHFLYYLWNLNFLLFFMKMYIWVIGVLTIGC